MDESNKLLSTDDSEQPTQTSKAIISSIDWNTLDFGDIEKVLASKLSDEVIDKILRNIDAVNDLQILKLAGCVNIMGSGLDVLRGSVAIKQIDMSLVGNHEVPDIEPAPLLSEDIVLPILDDINIIIRETSLVQLELPKRWRARRSIQLGHFLERYDRYLTNQSYRCSICCRGCVEEGDGDEWVDLEEDECYGLQNFTCFGCLKHFCNRDDCRWLDEVGLVGRFTCWCRKCEKEYCKNCVTMNSCVICDDDFCNECVDLRGCEQEGCGEPICEGCSKENTCSYCNERRCESCSDSFQCGLDGCNKVICEDCIVSKRVK